MHITNRCHKNCFFCYNRGLPQNDIDKEVLFRCVDWFQEYFINQKMGSSFLSITGGDPTLHSEFEAIVEHYRDRQWFIMLNSETVNKDLLYFLKKNNVQGVQFSLDGLKEYHDSVRGKGDFERTLYTIHLCLRNNIKVGVMYTVNKDNQKDLLPLIKFLA